MHSLAQHVLSHIRRQEFLKAGDRAGVAVSGGIDSVALLRLLLELRGELGIVLSVVHFNHKLRGAESDGDEQFVANLAREHNLEFFSDSDDVAQLAADEHISVEAAARDVRYGFLRNLLGESDDPQGLKPSSAGTTLRGAEAPLFHGASGGAVPPVPFSNRVGSDPSSQNPRAPLDKIATGHTLDDQAETVLMHMIRGTGMRGLGAIHPRILVEDDDGELCGEIVRPLLEFRRRELEPYLREIGQCWREDSSNADAAFTRNRVRKLLVPLLEKEFNPSVAENLAELAEIARGEEDYWENEVAGWMGTAVHWSEPEWARVRSDADRLVRIAAPENISTKSPDEADLQSRIDAAPWLVANASVDCMWFLGEPVAVQRRLVKAIGEHAGIPLEFKHVEEVLAFVARTEPTKLLSLPLEWTVMCRENELLFLTPDLRRPDLRNPGPPPDQDYEYPLTIPARIDIREAGLTLEVQKIPADDVARHNPDALLDAESLSGALRVRNWRAGDRFWPAHTKSAKKVKELLQEHHVPAQERKLWPVVVSGDEIVWVRGFPASARFRPKPGQTAILITASPAAGTSAPAVSSEEKRTTGLCDK